MEPLTILEQKVLQLVTLANELKIENSLLRDENILLAQKVENLERSMHQELEGLNKLNNEREATKTLVDDLIKNIDSLVNEVRV